MRASKSAEPSPAHVGNLNRRPYISEEAALLAKKIRERGVTGFDSEGAVIEAALKLLWSHEKALAFQILNKKEAEFYGKHPEEKDFLAAVQELKS